MTRGSRPHAVTKASPSSDTGVWGFSRRLLCSCVKFRVPGEGIGTRQAVTFYSLSKSLWQGPRFLPPVIAKSSRLPEPTQQGISQKIQASGGGRGRKGSSPVNLQEVSCASSPPRRSRCPASPKHRSLLLLLPSLG